MNEVSRTFQSVCRSSTRGEELSSETDYEHDKQKCNPHEEDNSVAAYSPVAPREELAPVVHLYDRQRQQEQLTSAYERVASNSEFRLGGNGIRRNDRERVVVITGSSGTGKTALALTLRGHTQGNGGLFIMGKFDQLKQSTAYVPFRSALSDFCRQILEQADQQVVKDVRKSILEHVHDENVNMLCQIIPGLAELLSMNDTETMAASKDLLDRVRVAFCSLLRAICHTRARPTVLFIDDLQWADEESLELLKSIALDQSLADKLLLVGGCRGNEVAYSDELSAILRHLEDVHKLRILEIKVGNLNAKGILIMVANELGIHPGSVPCHEISEWVVSKTGGNIFAATQLLQALLEYKVVHKEGAEVSWNPEAATNLIFSSQSEDGHVDPATIVLSRIRLFPEPVQMLLRVAACFGTQFSQRMLSFVTNFDLDEALGRAEELGLILKAEEDRYKFIHDKVQQASYALMTQDEVEIAHLTLGTKLFNALSSEELQEEAVMVASQLGRSLPKLQMEEDRVMFAKLCLQATRNLVNEADFNAGLAFLNMGRNVLPVRHWRDHYDVSVALFRYSAEICTALGKHEETARLVQDLRQHARSPEDAAQARFVSTISLSAQQQLKEAIDESVKISSTLGEPIPSDIGRWRFKREVNSLRRQVRKLSDDDILNLPTLCDKTKLLVYTVYCRAYGPASATRPMFANFLGIRLVRLTLRYGLAPISATGFMIYAIVLAIVVQNLEESYRFGNIAMKILDKFSSTENISRVIQGLYSVVFVAQRPPNECIKKLAESSKKALRIGETYCGVFSLHFCDTIAVWAGFSLREQFDIVKENLSRAGAYRLAYASTFIGLHAQFMENLLDEQGKGDPCSLTGTYSNEARLHSTLQAKRNDSMLVTLYALKLYTAIVMSEYVVAKECVLQLHKLGFSTVPPNMMVGILFLEAILHLSVSSSSRLGGSLRRIKACLHKLREHSRLCPSNQMHRICILEAKLEWNKEDFGSGLQRFESAMNMAQKHGYLFEHALACELAGRALCDIDRFDQGIEYLQRAAEVFNEWGAVAKSTQLTDHLLPQIESILRERRLIKSRA